MKLLFILLIVLVLVVSFFFYQGRRSIALAAPEAVAGALPVCGSRPNCVCSQCAASEPHYIEPISLNQNSIQSVREAIAQLGGTIVEVEGNLLRATFTSKLFRFVDDVLLLIDGNTLHCRSSSRVGHSDLGANRKRMERLRKLLSSS